MEMNACPVRYGGFALGYFAVRSSIGRIVLLLLAISQPALGQDESWELVGQLVSIEDGDDKPIKLSNVHIIVREFGRMGITDDQGLFVIQMPAAAKPGQEISLQHDKDGYEIFFPYRG